MSLATRNSLILLVMLAVAAAAYGQAPPPVTDTTAGPPANGGTATATSTDAPSEAPTDAEGEPQNDRRDMSVYELRNHFMAVIEQQPGDLPILLKLDPALLTNAQFLENYPALATFLRKNPEIARNPQFYLAEYRHPSSYNTPLSNIVEALAMAAAWILSVFALGWLVRTIIEQKRWNKLSKTQSEVHNKILDRFGSSEELLAYVKSPAGTKFLESAPIPLHVEKSASQSAPGGRIIRSIQIGVSVTAGALGLLLVSLRFNGDTSEGLFAMGGIAFCLGAGFIASALVSIHLSRKLGLWESSAAESERSARILDDLGGMR
jgi:hypothetical protein